MTTKIQSTLWGVSMAGWLAQAAVTPPVAVPTETAQSSVIHDEDIVPLHTSRNETTLIVFPEKEKAMGVFCGDKTYWNVDVIPGAERYVAVKPSKTGVVTDIHIVTDHNNSYTFQATGGGCGPVALKIFVKPSDASSLKKPPVFVSATVANNSLVDVSAVLAEASPFLTTPFKPCVRFSRTPLNDDLTGVACAGYFTVPINLCRPIP